MFIIFYFFLLDFNSFLDLLEKKEVDNSVKVRHLEQKFL